MDLNKVAPLPLVQSVVRQRVDVPLNQRRSKRRRRWLRSRQRTVEFARGRRHKTSWVARDHRPCWPGPDRRPSGQQAADRERTCPRAMTHRAESGIGGLRITHYRTYPLSNHERRDSIVLCFLTFFSIRLSKRSIFFCHTSALNKRRACALRQPLQ